MIYFYSTRQQEKYITLEEAIFRGLASDGGLYMPHEIFPMEDSFIRLLPSLSFTSIAFQVARHFLDGAIPDDDLKQIVVNSIDFDAPLYPLTPNIFVLELFHGPTLSFKDFGARFMAQLLGYFAREKKEEVFVLVATSGDTGSAIADGFSSIPGVRVLILYPKGKISPLQEKQMTTIDNENVMALEIDGTFDDCQTLVKAAFNDADLGEKMVLTSANSINIARLIPQCFYYFYAYAQLRPSIVPVVFSVPCGNFGNLTAGLFAKRLGLPIKSFVAATNINDTFPKFLETGHFQPMPSKQTISNAMDVGNPSNFARILDLYGYSLEKIRQDISAESFDDAQTREGMLELFNRYGYVADPHGAIAYLGLKSFQAKGEEKTRGIFFETAHPSKFIEVVEPVIGRAVALPEKLKAALSKEKQTIELSAEFVDLKEFLLGLLR